LMTLAAPPAGVTWRSYYYAGATRIAMRAQQAGAPDVVYYFHADHLGSASLTTDASGAKYGELRYKPYGETRYVWGVTPTDRRFTGQRSEEASLGSLYDYGARFMSPVLGRFLSADTMVPSPGNPQSLNRYSYVLGNPLKFVDPTGHGEDCGPTGRDKCQSDPPPPDEPTVWDWVNRLAPDGFTFSGSFNLNFAKPIFSGEVDIVVDWRKAEVVVFASPAESVNPSINDATGFPNDNPASRWGKNAFKPVLPYEMPFASPSISASATPGLVWSDDHFARGVVNEFSGLFHNLGAGAGIGVGAGWNVYVSADSKTGAPAMTEGNVGGFQVPVGFSLQPGVEFHNYVSYSRPVTVFGVPLVVKLR